MITFKISRTSVHFNELEKIDIPKGFKVELMPFKHIDRRTVKTIDEARNKPWFKQWWNLGENHREENGTIVAERKESHFSPTVTFNDLEELMDFINKTDCKKVVIEYDTWESPIIPKIEIYDNYRE